MESSTLTLLGINVGIGFVYYALPVARYRNRLFEAIADSVLRDRPPENAEPMLHGLMLAQDSFRQAYGMLAHWLGELPNEYGRKVRQDGSPTISDIVTPERGSSAGSGNKKYKWFKNDCDRITCIAVCSVLPILVVWADVLDGDYLTATLKWLGPICAFLGQICVLAHIRMGRNMVASNQKAFDGALALVVKELRDSEVKAAAQVQVTHRPPSSAK